MLLLCVFASVRVGSGRSRSGPRSAACPAFPDLHCLRSFCFGVPAIRGSKPPTFSVGISLGILVLLGRDCSSDVLGSQL